MPAIVTSKFRFQNAKNLISDITDVSNSYYLFVGRTQPWTPSDSSIPSPQDRLHDEYNAWSNAIALKKIAASHISHVAPRYNWVAGTTYAEYDDQDVSLTTKKYFVVT